MKALLDYFRAKNTFCGGVHPSEYKDTTASLSIETLPLPKKIILPLSQHIGAPCKVLVAKGDQVLAGQKVGEATGFVSAPVHTPVSGLVLGIDLHPHPLGKKQLAVVIKPDQDQKIDSAIINYQPQDLSPEKIKERIKEAGIVGLGGATFPTHVKLTPPKEKPLDTILINACECEPYLSVDHRTLLEKTEQFLTGITIVTKVLGIKKVVIGIENNKNDAIVLLQEKINQCSEYQNIKILSLSVKYPQGAEKILIQAALKRTVPAGKLPLEVGVLVLNVGTIVAIYDAVQTNQPLTERILTVSGPGVKNPKNLRVKIGTLLSEVLNYCGGLVDAPVKVITGGPMMGITQHTLEVPVIKGTSGITCLIARKDQGRYQACISCGRCVEVCPRKLIPCSLGTLGEYQKYQVLKNSNITDCMECGSCVYICPSKRPLVQWIKIAKMKIKNV
jgi:electron transport complex protein RnfC